MQCCTGICCGISGVTMPKLRPFIIQGGFALSASSASCCGTPGLGLHFGLTQAEQKEFGMSGRVFLCHQWLWGKECWLFYLSRSALCSCLLQPVPAAFFCWGGATLMGFHCGTQEYKNKPSQPHCGLHPSSKQLLVAAEMCPRDAEIAVAELEQALGRGPICF